MSTTSLGTLTLDLAVRLSEFTDGLSRAERETRDRTQEMSDSVGKFKEKLMDDLSGTAIGDAVGSLNEKLSSITEAFGEGGLAGAAAIGAASIIGSVAAIGAGLVTLALQTAETDEQLQRLATRANTSTTNLQVLTAATGAYGLEMESVGDILADAQEKLGEFSATGGGGLVDTLELMQNATKKTDAELEIFGKSLSTMDSVDAIQAVVNEMEQAGATTQEVRFVTESLASGLGDIIPLWDNNGEALRNYEHDLNEAGVIRTKESIEQSQLLANEVEGLQIKFEGVSNQLVTAALPAMATLIEYFKEGTTQGGSFKNEISGVGKAINITAASVVGLAAGMGLLINSFSAVGRQMANIGQTAQNFYNADNLADKGKALFTGFFSAGALASGSMLDISSQWAKDMETITKLLDGASSKMNKINTQRPAVNNSFGSVLNSKGNNVTFPYRNDGIPYRTGAINEEIIASRAMADAAEEEAKAKNKLAKSNDKAAKSLKELGSAYVSNTALSGLKLKSNEAVAGGKARGYTAEFAELTQSLIGGNLKYFSAINDTYHKGTSSKHATGQAFDIVLKDATKAKQAVAKLKAAAKEYGYQIKILDEYAKPSKNATGGHLHVSVYGQKDNGKGGADLAWIKQQNSVASSEMQKSAALALRAQEENERRKLSISGKWAYEKEKIELTYQNNVAEVKETYAKGSADYIKYMARVEEDYTNDKNAGLLSLSEKYFSEEQQIHDKHQKALRQIEAENIQDGETRQMFIDVQNAMYQKDLENFRWAAGAKAREQDKMYQSIANSAKANGAGAFGNGLDSMAQRTMGEDDYAVWRVGQDHRENYGSINDQYTNRQSEINAKDERGKDYLLPELERSELLELARQEHLDNMWAMEQDHALKQQSLDEQLKDKRVAMQENAFSAMTGAASMFFGENSKMHAAAFAMEKAFAVQKALMNIEETYSNTFNAISAIPLVGPYIAMPMAVAASAMQIASAAGIQGMSAPSVSGIAHGGLDYVPKESTYLLDKGERVLSPKQNKDLVNFMQQGNNSAANNTQPPTPQNLQINNILDPSIVGDFMGTSSGTKTFMNFIKNNRSSIKAMIS